MINICTKYGFDSLIISGSYGGHRRHTTDDRRRTTPGVWHKLPTGELKMTTDGHLVVSSTGSNCPRIYALAPYSFCVHTTIGFCR